MVRRIGVVDIKEEFMVGIDVVVETVEGVGPGCFVEVTGAVGVVLNWGAEKGVFFPVVYFEAAASF